MNRRELLGRGLLAGAGFASGLFGANEVNRAVSTQQRDRRIEELREEVYDIRSDIYNARQERDYDQMAILEEERFEAQTESGHLEVERIYADDLFDIATKASVAFFASASLIFIATVSSEGSRSLETENNTTANPTINS